MFGTVKELLRKHKYVFAYLVIGVLTTAVNFVVYYPLFNNAGFSAALSNAVAWIVAVIFAFAMNKPFVYRSADWSAKTTIPEFMKFIACRAISGFAETGLLFLTVDILLWSGNIMKILISILVVVMNYITGKFIVFQK